MLIDLTGEVLPCAYFHFANKGNALGNTNRSTVDEIWNGPEYQALRARHVAGDLEGHPCGDCVAYRQLNGEYPSFEWGDSFRLEQGSCYIAHIPESFWERYRDTSEQITLCEDGKALPYPQCLHDDIRRLGGGRYSVWRGFIYMSTVDGSNPCCNGRTYEVRCGGNAAAIATLKLDSASGRNLIASYAEYRDGATKMTASPSKMVFIETSDCNIDCPACSQNEVRLMRVKHRPETGPDVLAHVPLLQELIWHGGEPYMMPRFRRFVAEFTSELNPNLSFGFMSNGTMITAPEANRLESFDRFNVTISVDSFVKETYEKMRFPAKYESVMENLFRLLAMQDWPKRKVTVAMIIGKSNLLDLSRNIRFALEHDIRLMVNPITQYPPTERLTIFDDFRAQTCDWDVVISEAEELLEDASRLDRQSLRNLDPRAPIRDIRALYQRHKAEQADILELKVSIDDPYDSLAKMRRPGLLVAPIGSNQFDAVAYAELGRTAGMHTVRIPKRRFKEPLQYSLCADLLEVGSEFRAPDHVLKAASSAPLLRTLVVPQYEAPLRPKNIKYVKINRDGLHLRARGEMSQAYAKLVAKERAAGFGFQGAIDDTREDVRESWWRFLVNYFRPYAPKGYGEPRHWQ